MTGTGERTRFACPACQGHVFEVAVSLAYEFSDDEIDEGEDLASRPQDFFTWFNLTGRCVACGGLVEIADYECS
jgi:hypothetical protein